MNVNISFTGMEPSDALKKYVEEKLTKHSELLKDVTGADVVLKEKVASKGVDKDFSVSINIVLPKAVVRVEEFGSDMYSIVDSAGEILVRRLRSYYDRKDNWDGVTPWKVLETQRDLEEDSAIDNPDNYTNYTPKISRRVTLEDLTPMQEGEAIEKMELLGDTQILFKNTATGKFSMIYKSYDGGFVLVEPSDTLEL